MRLDIRGQHVAVTDALRAHVERRLRGALGRFGRCILQVTVHLADPGGPRRGGDKRCQIAVAVSCAEQVVAEVLDIDLYTAIDRAADRIVCAVARELEQRYGHPLRVPVVSRVPASAVFRRLERLP